MKKIVLSMLLMMTALSCLSAAAPGFGSRDADAIRRHLKSSMPAIDRIGYELRLQELEGKVKIKSYDEYCRAIFRVGLKLKVKPMDVEDAKVVLPYITGRFAAQALELAHKNSYPYELRYLTAPHFQKIVNKLLPTPKERYMRTMYLLKWNTAKYHDWGANCQEVIKGLEYMKAQAAEGGISRFKDDIRQLKLCFGTWRVLRPAQWQPVYDWLERNGR